MLILITMRAFRDKVKNTLQIYNSYTSSEKGNGDARTFLRGHIDEDEENASVLIELTSLLSSIIIAPPSDCLLYTSPSPRDRTRSRMPSSA